MSPPRSCFVCSLSGVCGSSGMVLVEHASPISISGLVASGLTARFTAAQNLASTAPA